MIWQHQPVHTCGRSHVYGSRDERRKRPDAVITGCIERWMIDVSVINPTSRSYKGTASGRAPAREAQKSKKFDELAAREQATFVPFVLETYGTWGADALEFLRTLADEAVA